MRGNSDTTLATYLNSLRLFIGDALEGDESALVEADRGLLEVYADREPDEHTGGMTIMLSGAGATPWKHSIQARVSPAKHVSLCLVLNLTAAP